MSQSTGEIERNGLPKAHEEMMSLTLEDIQTIQPYLRSMDEINAYDEKGMTPLLKASEMSNVRAVAILLKAKASVNGRDQLGWTVLHQIAHRCNDTSILRMLLDAKASVNAIVERPHSSLLKIEMSYIDKRLRGSWGWVTKGTTPLHIATRIGPAQANIIKALIAAKANIQAKTRDGSPAEYFQKYILPKDKEAFTGIMTVAAPQLRAAFFAGHHPRAGIKSNMALAAANSLSIFTPNAWRGLFSLGGIGNIPKRQQANSEENQNTVSFRA